MSDLTPAELHLLWHTYERWEEGDDFAEHMSGAVGSILAARLAPVEADRDQWKARRDNAVKQCQHLHQDGKTREQWHTDNCGAMQEVQRLRAGIEALIAEYPQWAGEALHAVPVTAIRALLDNPGTALDAVRAEAKAEERERIALAIEAWGGGRPNAASWQTNAARIAREEVQA